MLPKILSDWFMSLPFLLEGWLAIAAEFAFGYSTLGVLACWGWRSDPYLSCLRYCISSRTRFPCTWNQSQRAFPISLSAWRHRCAFESEGEAWSINHSKFRASRWGTISDSLQCKIPFWVHTLSLSEEWRRIYSFIVADGVARPEVDDDSRVGFRLDSPSYLIQSEDVIRIICKLKCCGHIAVVWDG